MWLTAASNGKRYNVRQEDVELLLCALAKENETVIIYATFKLMASSKQMTSRLIEILNKKSDA